MLPTPVFTARNLCPTKGLGRIAYLRRHRVAIDNSLLCLSSWRSSGLCSAVHVSDAAAAMENAMLLMCLTECSDEFTSQAHIVQAVTVQSYRYAVLTRSVPYDNRLSHCVDFALKRQLTTSQREYEIGNNDDCYRNTK